MQMLLIKQINHYRKNISQDNKSLHKNLIAKEFNKEENSNEEQNDNPKEESDSPKPETEVQLVELIFEPLRPYLTETNQLFISTDSQLNLIPFQILPNLAPKNKLLKDQYDISYITTGRDILAWESKNKTKSNPCLIMGDPDFGLTANSNTNTPLNHELSNTFIK